MTNLFKFHCPVTNGDALLTDCEDVHSKSMKGQAPQIENKLCGLAHQCWMCPIRNAFRVGGPWSHYDKKPHSAKPMDSAAKLPSDLVRYSLAHTAPNHADYRRVGLTGGKVGCHDEYFRDLHKKIGRVAPQPAEVKKRTVRKSKKNTLMDGLNQDKDYMAKALTEAARRERPESASSSSGSDDTQKRAIAPRKRSAKSQSASAVPTMSLAERAKLMRERKAAQ